MAGGSLATSSSLKAHTTVQLGRWPRVASPTLRQIGSPADVAPRRRGQLQRSKTFANGSRRLQPVAIVNGSRWLFGEAHQSSNDKKGNSSKKDGSTAAVSDVAKSKKAGAKGISQVTIDKASPPVEMEKPAIENTSVLEEELHQQMKQLESELAEALMENKTLREQLACAEDKSKRAETSLQENFAIVMEARKTSMQLVTARKEIEHESERMVDIAASAEEMHRGAQQKMAEALAKVAQVDQKVAMAETKAETAMSDAKKLVEMERSTAASVESGAAQKAVLSEQAASALIASTKAVYAQYSEQYDQANEQRVEILANALKEQEARLKYAEAAASLRLSEQERLFAAMEEATQRRVEAWEVEVGLRLQTAEMDAEEHIAYAREEAAKEVERVRSEMMEQAKELQSALQKQLASVNKAHADQVRILEESHVRQLESERQACQRGVEIANKHAVEMEMAAQRLVSQAEISATERIIEMKANFAKEYEALEQQLKEQTETTLQLQDQLLQQRKEKQLSIALQRDSVLEEQQALVKRMEEKLKSVEELHAQEMQNLRDVKAMELQLAQSQLLQAQKRFAKELKMEATEREAAHAEAMKLAKERYEEAIERAEKKSVALPERIAELEAALELAEQSRIVEIEKVKLESANKVADVKKALVEERAASQVELGQSQRYTIALKRALKNLETNTSGLPEISYATTENGPFVSEDQVGPLNMPRNGRIFAVFKNGVEVEKIITTGPKQMQRIAEQKHEEMMEVHEELKQQRLLTAKENDSTTSPEVWASTNWSMPNKSSSNESLPSQRTLDPKDLGPGGQGR